MLVWRHRGNRGIAGLLHIFNDDRKFVIGMFVQLSQKLIQLGIGRKTAFHKVAAVAAYFVMLFNGRLVLRKCQIGLMVNPPHINLDESLNGMPAFC